MSRPILPRQTAPLASRPGRPCAAALAALIALAALGGCNRERPLPGTRIDPRAVVSPDGPSVEGQETAPVTAVALPAAQSFDWTQRAGNARHQPGNAALGGGTARLWSARIGQPDDLRHRITADPVVAAGRVFALDSRARVTALARSGGTAWSVDLTPAGEVGDSASGGGLAFDAGRVFVTTDYSELVALDATSGAVVWRQRLEAPSSAPPTAANGVVYAQTRAGVGWAVRQADGKVLWTTSGIASPAGVMGVSSPAVDGGLVVFPAASGQLLAVDAETGIERWSAQVAGTRVGRAIGIIRDVTGDPVIAGNRVIAGTSSGRVAAFDRETGQQVWSARDGANSPPVVAGGSVFVVNDQAQLVRLDAATGARVYAVSLPYYTDARVRRQDSIHVHYGPVMAGGRLFVASSDGLLRVFDPATGRPVGRGSIPGGAASAPVVSGGVLYVAGRDGQLHAFR